MGKTILYLFTITIFFLVFMLMNPQDAFSISISSIDWGLSSASHSTDNPHAIFYYSFRNDGDIRNRFYVTGIVEDPSGSISTMTPRRIYVNPGEIGKDMLTWNPTSGTFPEGQYSAQIIIWQSEHDYEENKNRLFTDRIYNAFVIKKSPPPPPDYTYHNTQLSLQVTDGSSQGSIKVKPTLTYGSGNPLATSKIGNKILIYVDGTYKTKVASNQWSSNIYTGSGSHTIRADFTDVSFPDSSTTFRASSDTKNYFVTPPNITYDNTQLSLQVTDGLSQGSIKVKPTLTYGSGNKLSNYDVSISVDGKYKTKVVSNQLSSNIYTGSGSHTIKASFSETTSNFDSSIRYRASSDTENNYFVSGGGSSVDGFPIEYVVVAVAIAAAAGSGIALSRRKKTVPVISVQPAKVPATQRQDDTQFWVCPNCGNDTQMKDGRQYCFSCKIYLSI